MTIARNDPRWYRGFVKDACFPRCCSTFSLLRHSSSHKKERFSEDVNKSAGLAHFQEQPAKVGPENALECARRAICEMLYADDACIVWRSLRELVATRVGTDNGGPP